MIASHRLPTKRQLEIATRENAEALPNQVFHITISNFSYHLALLPHYVVIAHAEPPPSVTHECQTDN